MALGTTDRRAPPLFRRDGPLHLRWAAWSTLAVLLLLADVYWQVAGPLRAGLSAALTPIQTVASSPVRWALGFGQHFADLSQAQSRADKAQQALIGMGLQNAELHQLREENARLRQLFALKEQRFAQGVGVEVLFATADPYSRKVIINKGSSQGVQLGSPVLGAQGVLGQVTQLYLRSAEVNLLTSQSFAIPVRNQRTGAASVAYGLPMVGGGALELKYLPSNVDVQVGDVLMTSGMDGVYPPDLAVAKVSVVERRTPSSYARVYAQPLAQMGAAYALLLPPVGLGDIDPQALAALQAKKGTPVAAAVAHNADQASTTSVTPLPVHLPTRPATGVRP